MRQRTSRVVTFEQAAALVPDGAVVGLGGFTHANAPMALVRELIRRRRQNLTIVSGPTAGLDTDLLIAAGAVREVVAAAVTLDGVAGIAPAFRRAAERGEIAVWECDECIWHLALKTAALAMPYMLWRGGVGTSLPDLNRDLQLVRENERWWIRIPPRFVDVTLLHAECADQYGTVQLPAERYFGRTYAERSLVGATRGSVIVSVERLVSSDEIASHPERTILHGAVVVLAPFGAHPAGLPGRYVPDLARIRQYAGAVPDPSQRQQYLDGYVTGLGSHDDYLGRFEPLELEQLRVTGQN